MEYYLVKQIEDELKKQKVGFLEKPIQLDICIFRVNKESRIIGIETIILVKEHHTEKSLQKVLNNINLNTNSTNILYLSNKTITGLVQNTITEV